MEGIWKAGGEKGQRGGGITEGYCIVCVYSPPTGETSQTGSAHLLSWMFFASCCSSSSSSATTVAPWRKGGGRGGGKGGGGKGGGGKGGGRREGRGEGREGEGREG